ncbi:hypothetical protein GS490_13360 [Rhodococcus hoagii]|nr:hypothetical protein [Prescottella equi]
MSELRTPHGLLFRCITSIQYNSADAIAAGRDLLEHRVEGDALWRTVNAFVFSSATVGAMFAPGKRRYKAEFPSRPAELCSLCNVTPEDFGGIRLLRNDLAHLDERYEESFLHHPDKGLAHYTTIPETYVDETESDLVEFHCWIPSRNILRFQGRFVDVASLTGLMEKIYAALPEARMAVHEDQERAIISSLERTATGASDEP